MIIVHAFCFKVDTLAEDIDFIEEILGIESAWQFQQDVSNSRLQENSDKIQVNRNSGDIMLNSYDKPLTYQQYMSQLTDDELDMLYTVHYQDFRVFSYDPCEGLGDS